MSGTPLTALGSTIRLSSRYAPVAITVGLFALVFAAGSIEYGGSFFSLQTFLNLFVDNAFLLVVAIGMTFVIISGGIDLSVGSVVALTTMVSASLLEHHAWNPYAVVVLVLAMGAAIGFAQGLLIQYFGIQPFIVTLAGLFLWRGLCYLISIDSISITNPFYGAVAQVRIPFPFETSITVNVVLAILMLVVAVYLAHFTKFGRTVYAIGGNEQSALLMGLPVGRTKVLIYTFSGFCSALAGVVFTFYMLSGYGLHAQGMELDTIAVTVMGGTLLTGGSGYVIGTLIGVLTYGTIYTIINFNGELSSWWGKIVIGLLIFVFCVLQTALRSRKSKRRLSGPASSARREPSTGARAVG
jgi:simple sugar transport system permease protein